MCLTRIIRKLRGGKGTGYKVYKFKTRAGFRGQFNNCYYKIGQTYTAKKLVKKWWGQSGNYEVGFHIIPTLKEAIKWNKMFDAGKLKVKIEYRKAILQGNQSMWSNDFDTIVAKEITLIKEMETQL